MGNLEYKPAYWRHLPHIQPPGATLFVTFRLAGSIPSTLSRCLLEERELLEKQLASIEDPDERMRQAVRAERRTFAKWDQALDSAQRGPFWLSDQKVAALVAESLHSLDTARYTLEAYCIMPNHVHLVFTPLSRNDEAYYAMSSIMHSLKRHTGLRANQILARNGDFWQHENYDHIVRDEKEFCRIIEYVLDNPVSAGLVSKREDWQWCYRRASFQLAPKP